MSRTKVVLATILISLGILVTLNYTQTKDNTAPSAPKDNITKDIRGMPGQCGSCIEEAKVEQRINTSRTVNTTTFIPMYIRYR